LLFRDPARILKVTTIKTRKEQLEGLVKDGEDIYKVFMYALFTFGGPVVLWALVDKTRRIAQHGWRYPKAK
jgi:hypothetical protein